MAIQSFIFGPGQKYKTQEELERARELVRSVYGNIGAPKNVGEGLSALGDGIVANVLNRRISKGQGEFDANRASADSEFISSMPAFSASVAAGGSSTAPAATGVASGGQIAPEIKDGIVQTASSLGIDPVDLATAISYETAGTFDPTKAGPRTKWGQHKGLIQFGEPQAQQYGVDWNNPVGSQLGENGAVAKYLRDRGVKPGMGMLDIYSTINAGAPGLYNRSDEAAGGAPGTVGDKVRDQMSGHRAKAMALLGFDSQKPVQVASLDPSAGMAWAIPPQAQPSREEVVAQQQALAPKNGYADGQPVAAAPLNNPPQPAPVARPQVSQQALALRPQADPNDRLVASADQTLQPSAAELQGAASTAQAPQQAQSSQSQMQYLARAVSNPFLSPEMKRLAASQYQQLIEREQQASDPAYQLDIKYKQAQIDALTNKHSGAGDFKVVGDQLVRISPKGEISDVTPQQTGAAPTGEFRFGGKSVEAQALNGLMDAGTLTPAQAQQLGAGKTITGPNGEIIFMTPQGVFGQQPGGQPQPIGPPPQSGNIPITEPKVTLDEKKAMTFADRMTTSGKIIDDMGMSGSGAIDRTVSQIPIAGQYLTSDEYKKVDQAKRDFINAQLRRESGAVISNEEFANAEQQYFPQPNDPPEVIEQKRRNREIVVNGMQRDGGPTYKAPAAPSKRLKFNPATGELE